VTPEEAVRAYFAAYSEGRPEQFDEIVAPDYVDYATIRRVADPRARATTTRTRSSSQVAYWCTT
jgi:ketosteroid isomerase-like protein